MLFNKHLPYENIRRIPPSLKAESAYVGRIPCMG